MNKIVHPRTNCKVVVPACSTGFMGHRDFGTRRGPFKLAGSCYICIFEMVIRRAFCGHSMRNVRLIGRPNDRLVKSYYSPICMPVGRALYCLIKCTDFPFVGFGLNGLGLRSKKCSLYHLILISYNLDDIPEAKQRFSTCPEHLTRRRE